MTVPAGPVSTGGIRTAITQALIRGALIDAEQCAVTASTDGTVTLEGTVTSWSEWHQVDDVVRRAPGVVSVRNLITVLH